MNTLIGAAIAAAIAFLTGFMALLQQDGVEKIADIGQVPLVILIIGALITFLKDFQAIATRRLLNRFTHSGDGGGNVEPKPKNDSGKPLPIILLPLLLLGGCETLGYKDVDIDTTRKAIVVANAELRAANLLLQDLLQRDVISANDAQDIFDDLELAHENLQEALDAVDSGGDPLTAENTRASALRTINLAMQLMAPYVGDNPL